MSRNNEARHRRRRAKRRHTQINKDAHDLDGRPPPEPPEVSVPHTRITLSDERLGGKLPANLVNPVMDTPGLRHDADNRLATGIRVNQLVRESERWWTKGGRKAMLDGRKSQIVTIRTRRHYKGPFTLDTDDPNFMPSGVMHGLPWDNLNRSEKLLICKAYHEVKYGKPYRDNEAALILPSILVH